LLLREFVESDWSGVHEYARLPQVVRYMPWGPNTEEQTRQVVERYIKSQQEDPRLKWEFAVTLSQTGRVIGACGLTVNTANRCASIGYVYNPDVWGQGYATEAAGAILDLGFRHLDLHRVIGTCNTNNVASARVLEKCGMRREGHLIQDCLEKGRWRDSYLYAMLQSDWKERTLKEASV
jgi:RimJ/RimL family protein N-acetyltransferase